MWLMPTEEAAKACLLLEDATHWLPADADPIVGLTGLAKPTEQMRVSVVRDDTIPAFGAWHYDPAHKFKGAVLLNLEACFGPLEDGDGKPVTDMNTLEDRKRVVFETILHEFGHALETFIGMDHNEELIERAVTTWPWVPKNHLQPDEKPSVLPMMPPTP